MGFIYVGLASILIGCILFLPDFGMHWQGVVAILVGVGALGLYLRHIWTTKVKRPGTADRDACRPYSAEDFSSQFQNIVNPAKWASHHSLSNEVGVTQDGLELVVGYGEYLSSIPLTDDLESMNSGQHLGYAIEASPGADNPTPKWVGHGNISGLLEDDYVHCECQFPVTPANVLALQASKFSWTAAARQLALPVMSPEEAVEAVRRKMAELARQQMERIRNRHNPYA